MTTPDLIVFVGYIIGVLGIGAIFLRKNKTASAYILGDQSVPGWVVSLSFFATFVSSISYLALPGSAYQGDWSALTFSLSIPIAAVIAIYVFVPLYRRIKSPSAYTYLEQRFGLWARVYASTMYLLTQVMRVGTILYLMALTVHAVFNWELISIIVLTGGLVAVYSVVGGIQAVLWTDALQAIVLIGGAVLTICFLLWGLPLGPEQAINIALDNGKFELGGFHWSLSEPTFWVILIYGVFINLQNYGIDQNYVQRYMIARTEKEAKKAAFWGGMLYIPVSMMFLFIGSCLFAYYSTGVAELPIELTGENSADQVFPYFIVHQLPAGVTGILIASIFAAGMSTISTSFNSAATVILTDFVSRLSEKATTDKMKLKVLYISTLSVAGIGIMVAIAMINVKSVLDAWWKLASVFSGGMLGLFLLGVFSKKKNILGAIIGTICGLVVILYLTIKDVFSDPDIGGVQIHTYLTIVLGTLTIFLTGFAVGMIVNKRSQ
ncbi:MAG: sodium:solute symporter [Cyclobacteriaceae bacterium]|nr:MAG: sodium:solute symporter [Cyclobacteriaceae bacterium]